MTVRDVRQIHGTGLMTNGAVELEALSFRHGEREMRKTGDDGSKAGMLLAMLLGHPCDAVLVVEDSSH